ncbi:NAD(P)/FAD-dependent oxidoreductase [Povalibacter sp.]|uniref:flavin monoamine oxidase family protein n=1 Tax=Povalibacter sp. TaxID=1962978 RepID=UPI002F3F87E6
MHKKLSRRHFLQSAGLGLGGMVLSRSQALAAIGESGASGNGKKVLVLGAGMAGLAAALKLLDLGFQVTLLEARTWAGGRVHTIREPFSDGVYAEAGAGRIPSTHELTLEYVKRYGLELDPFYPASGSGVFLWRGQRQVVPYDGAGDLKGLPLSFTARERAAGFGGLSALYFDRLRDEIGTLPSGGWPYPRFNKYKDVSFGDFLRKQGASTDAIAYLTQGFYEDSLLDYAHDALSHAVPMLWKIRGGNDRLPLAMAGELSEHIRYGAEIRRIEQSAQGVKVMYQAGGVDHTETADRVVCTLPFTVLRDIEVAPYWSAGKADAVRNMYLGPVARVFVQTRTRFWEQQGLNGFATVDQPMEVWSPTYNQPGRRGIIMSYIYEDLAREYSALAPQSQIDRMLDLYEQVHPGVRDGFESATTWSWLNEKYSRGAFCVTKAGQFGLLEHAATVEGRIHFAGEHTSAWPGWIQGALHSGLRAANEIAAAP